MKEEENEKVEGSIDNLGLRGTNEYSVEARREALFQVDTDLEKPKNFKEDIARIIGEYNG
ncbi:hypothetical protein MWH28_00170 [Natroniella sulfidigena]|uniref:hypothetical protein n=1 Tax=Natroniella sulfidigena TaxID=723921 RepID=UPI00200AF9E9|nr:hypothetical protein [Natroniella sulfidigena]MCK8815781.1 hypothetical protein [Natroniella sulfidigena]